MTTPIYAIFEGGGAKGLAHVAGVAAAELNELEFIGVAGASAGALIATLVAVGYTASDMFDPKNPMANLLSRHGISPLSLIGELEWLRFAAATKQGAMAQTSGRLRGAKAAFKRVHSAVGVANEIRRSGGYFTTDVIRERLDYFLRNKLMEHHANAGRKVTFTRPIKFKDIDPLVVEECCSLKVIVTDITNQRPIIFGTSEAHAEVDVAEAVAASVSIPGVFKPARIPSYTAAPNAIYADGGLVSNLPIWVFAEEKLNYEREWLPKGRVPVLGFSLIDAGAQQAVENTQFGSIKNIIAYAKKVGSAAIFGGQTVVREFVPDLVHIPMPIRLKTTEFDFTLQGALDAYYEASAAAVGTLVQEFRVRPTRINQVLADFHRDVVAAIHNRFPLPDIQRLRINLIRRFGTSSLRIVHSYNMSDDADDRLVFSRRAQGAPKAFLDRTPAFIDFGNTIAAGSSPYMTKYEFALVRKSLQSAICIPVMSAQAWELVDPAQRPEPQGVVAIDSDISLAHIFGDQVTMQSLAVLSLKFNEVFKA